MRFFIRIISQKLLIDFSQSCKGKTGMPSQYPFLPKIIKTLNRGISSRLALWNKYYVNTQKQMKANNLRNTIRVSTSSRGSHFIVHLRYLWDSKVSPCFKQVFAQRNRLLVGKLTRPDSTPCNIHRMKRIKSDNLVSTPENLGPTRSVWWSSPIFPALT